MSTTVTSSEFLEMAVRPHVDELFQAARALLGGDGAAERIVRETCVEAYRSARSAGFTGDRIGLFRILLRKIRRQRQWTFIFHFRNPSGRGEANADLLYALQQMPLKRAVLVLLADVMDFSYVEMRETLQLTETCVAANLREARADFRMRFSASLPEIAAAAAGN